MKMFHVFTIFVILCISGHCVQAGVPQQMSEFERIGHRDFQKFVSFLSNVVSGETSFRSSDLKFVEQPGLVGSFKYNNCAKADDEIVVPSNVSLKPDPIKLPGNVTAGGSVQIKSNVDSPVKLVLEVYVKAVIWVYVPCVDNVGSCTYDDICTYLKDVTCPPEFVKVGLDCKCPFSSGTFTIDSVTIDITEKAPKTGDLYIKANLYQDSKLVTCAEVYFTVAE